MTCLEITRDESNYSLVHAFENANKKRKMTRLRLYTLSLLPQIIHSNIQHKYACIWKYGIKISVPHRKVINTSAKSCFPANSIGFS